MPKSSQPLEDSDTVVVVMGPTGSGKSNIIDKLTGGRAKRAGGGVASVTDKVEVVRVPNHPTIPNLVVVDTPGSNDASRSDYEILKMIGEWMKKTYQDKVKITAILYMHRISDNRVDGLSMRNLRVFGQLTGETAAQKVTLVTTMWDRVKDQRSAERREGELKSKYWKEFVEHGATVARFDNSPEGAVNLITHAIDPQLRETLSHNLELLTEELGCLHRGLNETSAAKELYSGIQHILYNQRDVLQQLEKDWREKGDAANAEELQKEIEKIERQMEPHLAEMKRLKISLWMRFRSTFIFRGKSLSRGIEVGE